MAQTIRFQQSSCHPAHFCFRPDRVLFHTHTHGGVRRTSWRVRWLKLNGWVISALKRPFFSTQSAWPLRNTGTGSRLLTRGLCSRTRLDATYSFIHKEFRPFNVQTEGGEHRLFSLLNYLHALTVSCVKYEMIIFQKHKTVKSNFFSREKPKYVSFTISKRTEKLHFLFNFGG